MITQMHSSAEELISCESSAAQTGKGLCSLTCVDNPCCQTVCSQENTSRSGSFLLDPEVTQCLPAKLITQGFYKAFELTLGELKSEPRTLLLIGGARQLGIAQYLALLLPFTKIIVVDPDAEITDQAKAMIQCRLRFDHSPLESLPFDQDEFDLTVALNLYEFTAQPEKAIGEIGRVTRNTLIFSVFRPTLWRFFKGLPGIGPSIREVLEQNGFAPPAQEQPDWLQTWTYINRYAKILMRSSPFPFHLYAAKMRPCREERLILQHK